MGSSIVSLPPSFVPSHSLKPCKWRMPFLFMYHLISWGFQRETISLNEKILQIITGETNKTQTVMKSIIFVKQEICLAWGNAIYTHTLWWKGKVRPVGDRKLSIKVETNSDGAQSYTGMKKCISPFGFGDSHGWSFIFWVTLQRNYSTFSSQCVAGISSPKWSCKREISDRNHMFFLYLFLSSPHLSFPLLSNCQHSCLYPLFWVSCSVPGYFAYRFLYLTSLAR